MRTIGFQLYSARNFLPLESVFRLLAQAGYREVEGYGALYPSLDPGEAMSLKAKLERNGLTMPTAHFGLDLLEHKVDRVLEIARILGIKSIYCPYLAPEDRPADAAGWRAFGARLQGASKPYRNAGLDFGWHNHDFEFSPITDGPVPMELILAGGPDLSWEADVAWIAKGGADPFVWIKKYADRISSVHVKDIAPAGEKLDEDGWADVGHGTLPWGDLMAALAPTSAKHFIVEHDNPSDLKRLAERSIATIAAFHAEERVP
ncbi:sugar phosphate isomerase/epimerase family protein [Mycoplana dimorpha]|uniref:Sugar phosphate isomerase/epimerase n=1 Tax=Mycoplana dimorpha TaxID=28320 RepID=A0A2T5B8K8_MYCDI|nr:sugar phosphate isomerase/epimerase [Mycoplana dimorpha]PTM95321.1 sugar phosphate isomerase/epimerase [Mycoplana dimorpha]